MILAPCPQNFIGADLGVFISNPSNHPPWSLQIQAKAQAEHPLHAEVLSQFLGMYVLCFAGSRMQLPFRLRAGHMLHERSAPRHPGMEITSIAN
uniref:Uncharacterized protein n=1 Tax=Arundo donax TaxID=35708 RepID=A0A0A9BG99_ARUDO